MCPLSSLLGRSLDPLGGVFPGLAIRLAVFGANLPGNALRDTLDPRLRGRRRHRTEDKED